MSVARDISSLLVGVAAPYSKGSIPDAYGRVLDAFGHLDREVPDREGVVDFLRRRYDGEKVALDVLTRQGLYHVGRLRRIASKRKDPAGLYRQIDSIIDSCLSHHSRDYIQIGSRRDGMGFLTFSVLSRRGFPLPRLGRFEFVDPEEEPDDAQLMREEALAKQESRYADSGRKGDVFFAPSHSAMMNALLSAGEERYLFMKKEDLEKRLTLRCSGLGLGHESLMALSYLAVERDLRFMSRERSRKSVDSLLRSVADIAPLVRELDRIRDVVVYFNTRLVKSIIKKKNIGRDFNDLGQEGNIGLMKAYERYDYRRGYKFSTLATWWVRQAIERSMHEYRLGMHVPVHKNALYRKVEYVLDAADADPEERSKVDGLGEIEYVCQRLGLEHRDVKSILVQMKRAMTVSLNIPVGDYDDSELMDFVPDRSASHPESSVAVSDISDKIELMLSWLDPREAAVLRTRNGINCRGDATLAKVSELYPPGRHSSAKHLSRERIRQIEARAIRRLQRRFMFDERKLGAELKAFLADVDNEKYNIYQDA